MVDFKSDLDIAHYTLMVEGLPKNNTKEFLDRRITQAMQKMWPPDASGHSPFLKARVLGDYDQVYS